MAGYVNLQLVCNDPFSIKDKWMAFRLSDGNSDGVLYDTRKHAIEHQLHETLCAYFCFRNALGGVTPNECDIFLKFARDAYDAGLRLADPDGPDDEPFLSTRANDIYRGMMNARRYN